MDVDYNTEQLGLLWSQSTCLGYVGNGAIRCPISAISAQVLPTMHSTQDSPLSYSEDVAKLPPCLSVQGLHGGDRDGAST